MMKRTNRCRLNHKMERAKSRDEVNGGLKKQMASEIIWIEETNKGIVRKYKGWTQQNGAGNLLGV